MSPPPSFAKVAAADESLPMPRLSLILILALALPLQAEDLNLSIMPTAMTGGPSRYVLARQTYQAAMASGDGLLLVAAIRLARSVTLRPPTSWVRSTAGEARADQPKGRGPAADPGGPEAVGIARSFAVEVPDLLDLVYDLDAPAAQARATTASQAIADLGIGQTDVWRVPLFGEVPAELALIGDGDSPLSLTVSDDAGQVVCARPAAVEPALCRFSPARNGFFTVEVRNAGTVQNSYRLVGN